MPTSHTGNAPFHSRSGSVGATRWKVSPGGNILSAYVLDMKFQPYLPQRWYLLALSKAGSLHTVRVHGAGDGEECSLDSADIEWVLAGTPVLTGEVPVQDATEAVRRFDRIVGNVMHNVLSMAEGTQAFWERLAKAGDTTPLR